MRAVLGFEASYRRKSLNNKDWNQVCEPARMGTPINRMFSRKPLGSEIWFMSLLSKVFPSWPGVDQIASISCRNKPRDHSTARGMVTSAFLEAKWLQGRPRAFFFSVLGDPGADS